MAFPNIEILDSILKSCLALPFCTPFCSPYNGSPISYRGSSKKKAGIRASDVSPHSRMFRIYWMSMWPMVTSTFLTGNCMMISIGIATWLELPVCKSWASRHPAGELCNADLVNAESSH